MADGQLKEVNPYYDPTVLNEVVSTTKSSGRIGRAEGADVAFLVGCDVWVVPPFLANDQAVVPGTAAGLLPGVLVSLLALWAPDR